MVKKIVILGPESTGKSTLCARLANHFDTGWVEEYARQYLLANGPGYTYDNLLEIAKGQIRLEDKAIAEVSARLQKGLTNSGTLTTNHHPRTGFIFMDTDMYVLKVWCEFVFGKCHQYILDQIATRKYDGYLLCDVDLPWVKDELREYPDFEIREKLYHYYKDILVNQPVPWTNISGNFEERVTKAIAAVHLLS